MTQFVCRALFHASTGLAEDAVTVYAAVINAPTAAFEFNTLFPAVTIVILSLDQGALALSHGRERRRLSQTLHKGKEPENRSGAGEPDGSRDGSRFQVSNHGRKLGDTID